MGRVMPKSKEKGQKEWSPQDIVDLEVCASIGDSAAEIAAFLSRSEEDVTAKAKELGIRISPDAQKKP
jgi:uncharacterized protein (DUF934 family)